MKKFKHIVPFLLALVMVIAIPMAGCGKKKKPDPVAKKTLQSISVNTDNAKTVFTVGDEFTLAGLVVKAVISDDQSETPEEVTLETGVYKVDSTAYKKDVVGAYPIKVSYTYEDVTKDDTYQVTVRPVLDGLEVTLADGVEDTYALSATQTSVEIDTNKIVVKDINRDGTVGNVTTGYTTKLFKGQEEISLTDGKARVGGGAYAIWVEKASDVFSGYNRSAFVLIYVNDAITSFELKSGTFTQTLGEDVISQTWLFTATYASGVTKDISGTDCKFDMDTMTVAKDVPLTITYTDVNAKGDKIEKTYDTTYTINMVYGKTTYRYDYSAIDYSEMGGDQTDLKQSDLKGPNTFLKLADGTAKYRNKTVWNEGADVVEIKNKGFLVTFFGVGTIKIGFSSTGGSNQSRVGLMDATNTYIQAEYDETNGNITKDTEENVYLVKGTASSELTFKITKAGTYAIVSEPNSSYNRGCRIHSVEMEDNVDDPANIICDVDFTDSTRFDAGDLAKNTATAPVEIREVSGVFSGLSVTKSSSSRAANKIVAVNGKNVLQLQGNATTAQNSLVFDVKAGKVQITVKYSSSRTDGFINIFDANGVIAHSSELTSGNGNIVEYTVTLDVSADATWYLGSNGLINISYLKVEKV